MQEHFILLADQVYLSVVMNKSQKRKKRIQLSFIYTVMVLAIVCLVSVLALLIQGYRMNWYSGRVEQGGLVQFDTHPDGAYVQADQVQLGSRTPSKITLSAGEHTITMRRDGYHDWTKTVQVKQGGVLWLDYARLVSTNARQTKSLTMNSIDDSIASDNDKYLAYTEEGLTTQIKLVQLSGDVAKETAIVLDSTAVTESEEGTVEALSLEKWDKDSRFILLKHTYNTDKSEWLLLDTQGSHELKNITKTLGVAIEKIEFSRSDSRKFYVLTDAGDVRLINLGNDTISGPLVSNIADFSLFSDTTLAYTTHLDETTKRRSVGYLTLSTSTPRTVRSYADDGSQALHFRIGEYYNENYFVISYGPTIDILEGSLRASDSKTAVSFESVATLTVPDGVEALDFSPAEHRFVYGYNKSSVFTYDLELLQSATVELSTPLTRDVEWIDSHHFMLTHDKTLYLYDFDGANKQAITQEARDNLPVVLSPNQKYIYSFIGTESGVALQQTKLVNN